MAKAGVIGWPVSHSLSPRVHGYWLKQYGIDGEYVALAVEPGGLRDALKALKDEGWRGANLTIPHKEAAMALVDETDETAQAIGAANTLIIEDGKIRATNTDAYGFAESLRQAGALKVAGKAVVLGSGGAARAVCHALAKEGYARIALCARTFTKAEALASGNPLVTVHDWNSRSALLADADLLVNATSLGLQGQPPLEIDLTQLSPKAAVTDIVYAPLVTPLLAHAKARGNTAVDGLGMLLHQAVPGFEAWFKKRPKVDAALRSHVLDG